MTNKRFIRYEELLNQYDMDKELLEALIKASGAVFQLPKIRLVKLEEFERYMKHFTTVGRSTELIQRKFVRVKEGVLIYNIGKARFVELARAAGAVYKVGDNGGCRLLIRLDVFDDYMERYRQEPRGKNFPIGRKELEYKKLGDKNYITKKYINAPEGHAIYGISSSRIMEIAKSAGAIYKVGESALINTDILECYLEKYRENPVPLPRHYVDKARMMKYNK